MGITATTLKDTREEMQKLLDGIVPEFEIDLKAELVFEINELKRERGAIILGHNYMEPALFHTVPDIVGDSLALAREAALTDCDPIVFCGVHFMAETAKILNPTKTVLLPADEAGCSLAASITAADVRKLREDYPGIPIVTYINTTAEVKAEVDICCTSGNAKRVLESLDAENVIFIPDEYLAANLARETGKNIFFPQDKPTRSDVDPNVILGWHGKCEVHDQFTVADIENVRKQFPEVEVLAHPECSPEVVLASDFSGSTSEMIARVQESDKEKYLLMTECSMADNIMAENRDKDMVRLCSVRCPHMNQITLEDTLRALRHNVTEVELDEEVRLRAKASLERMLAI